jgi:hypothetical protein
VHFRYLYSVDDLGENPRSLKFAQAQLAGYAHFDHIKVNDHGHFVQYNSPLIINILAKWAPNSTECEAK